MEARVAVSPPTSDAVFHLRILLELDRIGSALETMISLMDDREVGFTTVDGAAFHDTGHPYDSREMCQQPSCDKWARKGHVNCKEHAGQMAPPTSTESKSE